VYGPCKMHSCLLDRESENIGSHMLDVNIRDDNLFFRFCVYYAECIYEKYIIRM